MVTVVFLLYKLGNYPDDLYLLTEHAIQKALQNQSEHKQFLKKI